MSHKLIGLFLFLLGVLPMLFAVFGGLFLTGFGIGWFFFFGLTGVLLFLI